MSFAQNIQKMAMERLAKEQAEARALAERMRAEALAAEAALVESARQARIRAEQEREEARIRAERAQAEERARLEAEAIEAAVVAELNRLRNRSPLEVLQDEVAALRAELAEAKENSQKKMPLLLPIHTCRDGSLDMRYKTSRILSIQNHENILGADPAFGWPKDLIISYQLHGKKLEVTCASNQTITLAGPDLTILSATWRVRSDWASRQHGAPAEMVRNWWPKGEADVSDCLRALIRDM
jgi:hypothetical protein